MEFEGILKHYSREDVGKEIFEFSSNRWAALEGSYEGKRIFVRYLKGIPLKIESEKMPEDLVKRYRGINARTFYATINVYGKLTDRRSTEDMENVSYATPFFDIDGSYEGWKKIVESASLIAEFLERKGIRKGIYVLWSGEGAHVRINERSFSRDLLSKRHPLEVAKAIVDYTLNQLGDKLNDFSKEHGIKVENLVDPKRVFTVPLSLHRKRDAVAVCMRPDELASFEIDWTDPSSFKHEYGAWKLFDEGEGDELAREALEKASGSKVSVPKIRSGAAKKKGEEKEKEKEIAEGKIGRFQVMALLQAARYYLLYGDPEKAKSFGLNRAIFYAWAKRRGRGYGYASMNAARGEFSGQRMEGKERKESLAEVAGEEAYVSPRGFFIIGDKEQLPEDYDKSVAERIEEKLPYDVAWEAALKYLSKFPEEYLKDPSAFFQKIYEPVRDKFDEIVSEKFIEEREEEERKRRKEERKRAPEKKDSGLLKWMKSSDVERKDNDR